MMTVFAAVLFLALLISGIVFGIETIFPGRNKRVRIRLFNRLSYLAISQRMIISTQELFNHTLIGFNGVDRKLIIVHCLPSGQMQDYLVDLRDVAEISVHKTTGNAETIPSLQRIVLELTLQSNPAPLQITLFDRKRETAEHAADIASRACTWETLLRKMMDEYMPLPVQG